MLYANTHTASPFKSDSFDQLSLSPRPTRQSSADHQAEPLPSEQLLRGQKIVGILHNGSLYKLQATKLGKLILTK